MALALSLIYAWPSAEPEQPLRVVTAGNVDDFVPGSVTHFPDQEFWLVRLESGQFLAFDHRDPADGCIVPWRLQLFLLGKEGWFRNPCHGQTYDIEGNCVAGPCLRGLDRFSVSVRNDRVIVDTRTITEGPPPITGH